MENNTENKIEQNKTITETQRVFRLLRIIFYIGAFLTSFFWAGMGSLAGNPYAIFWPFFFFVLLGLAVIPLSKKTYNICLLVLLLVALVYWFFTAGAENVFKHAGGF